MAKILEAVQLIIFKAVLVAMQFFIWFFIIGIFSKVAGYIVGLITAFCLMAFMNVKRHAKL